MSDSFFSWSLGNEAASLIAEILVQSSPSLGISTAPDPLKLATHTLLRVLSVEKRRYITQQIVLRFKAKKKFPSLPGLYWTPLGLEQSTRESIGRRKAKYVSGCESVADLCCGLGGDSFFTDAKKIVGVDTDRWIVGAYTKNMEILNQHGIGVQGLAEQSPVRAELVMIDPARRHISGGKRWDPNMYTPGPEALSVIAKKTENLMIKWAPGLQSPLPLDVSGRFFVGEGDTCLEQWVCHGKKFGQGWVSAMESESGNVLTENYLTLQNTQLSISGPGRYLYEPLKMLIPSRLYIKLAAEHHLWSLDAQTAYLSSDHHIQSPWLKSYEIKKTWTESWPRVERELKKMGLLHLTIKQRGWGGDAPKAKDGQTCPDDLMLVLGRLGDDKAVFLVRPLDGVNQKSHGAE